MKTAAVIAEYNPFHTGHRYQIEQTRRLTGADYVLAVMSGDFVQRGAPAIYNKYIRTRMALLEGADAVIELPVLYALSSAEFFAQGGVRLLDRLGTVDFLSFGSEEGELSPILFCADLILSSPSGYQYSLSCLLRQGLSFPAARSRAILALCRPADREAAGRVLTAPNNILALEYCKSLLAQKSRIRPITLKRQGNSYHDTALNSDSSGFSSASAIRNAIERGLSGVEENYPGHFLTADDFSALLHYRLLMEQEDGFCQYLDCSREISDKIIKNITRFTCFTDFCALLKSKDVTYTRISRILMHILLDIRTPAAFRDPFCTRELSVPYARLLGFRRDCAPLLSAIKKNSSIPLVSKLADAPSLFEKRGSEGESALSILRQDVLASDIYESVYSRKYKRMPAVSEYRQSPVIIE